MINKVILVGNLGQSPEVKTTQSGTAVCTLSVATTDRRKDREGNWTDHTEWHKVVLWGKNAENAGKYLQKGRQVYVEGRLETQKWQDRNGQDRYTTQVVGEVVKFLGQGQGQGRGQERTDRSEPPPPTGDEQHQDFDSDLPF